MIRRLMASSAMLALVTAGAFSVAQAQTTPETEAPAAEAPAVEQPVEAAPSTDATTSGDAGAATPDAGAATTDTAAGTAEATLTPEQPTIATAYIGRSVFSSEEPESDNIGNVNDLIIGDEGMITHAVVGVGGFLGIGEKNVAVPFDELQVVEDPDGEVRLIYSATREQLESATAFDRTAFDPQQRAAETTAAADGAATTAPAGDMAATPPAADASAPASDMAAAPADPAVDATAPAGDMAAAPATDPAATDPAAPAATDTAAAPADTSAPAETDMAAAPATEGATDPAAAPATDMPAGSFVNYSADQMRASTMIGKSVFGPDDQTIGEVSDLVLDADGTTRSALIDVGGFLGVGEKRVAIPFTDIKPAAPDVNASADAEPKLTVAMTKEQLEQAPAYVDPTAAATTDTAASGSMSAETPAAGADTAAAPDATAPAAGTEAPATAQAQYAPVTQELTADNLMGAAVYGAADENLGEVGDIVFDPQGAIQAVVVDVGGFLGVGEKPVAVQFDSLQVQRDAGGEFRLKVNANQEALQNAPAYDETAAAEGQPQPTVQ